LQIPSPSKEIQKKIVSEINITEEKLINARNEIRNLKSLIHEKFKNIKSKFVLLGNVSTFKNGLNYSRSSLGEIIDIIGVKDFQDNFSPRLEAIEKVQIDGQLSEDYELKEKDILVVRSNGSANLVGRFLFIDKLPSNKTSYSGFTIRIRPINNNVDAKFLCHYLKTDVVREELVGSSKGSNIKSLNQTLLSSIKVPLPAIFEQQKIIAQIEEIENKIEKLENAIAEIPKQKEAILKKYLS
jgi:restriction endonuclease S subunit